MPIVARCMPAGARHTTTARAQLRPERIVSPTQSLAGQWLPLFVIAVSFPAGGKQTSTSSQLLPSCVS